MGALLDGIAFVLFGLVVSLLTVTLLVKLRRYPPHWRGMRLLIFVYLLSVGAAVGLVPGILMLQGGTQQHPPLWQSSVAAGGALVAGALLAVGLAALGCYRTVRSL
ncbi:MAG: hypothetical protein IVW57_16480, partial [Ktedonobacterales bacterium]|nr:hypothetical protein [Ktedonobacterales bacterium]